MTNDATYREKGRAVILAALMVLSVVAMSAAFAGGVAAEEPTAANYNVGPTISDGTIEEVWIGQEITLEGVDGSHDGFVSIAEGPDTSDNPDTVVTREADSGTVTLPTESLEEDGIYHIHVHGSQSGSFHGEAFRAQTENLDVEFTRSTVTQDSTGTLEVSSERSTQYVNVSSDSFDASELSSMFSSAEADVENNDEDVVTLQLADGGEYDVSFADVDQDSYDFDFDVTDSQGSDNASAEVVDSRLDYSFEDVDSVEQGGVANITVDVGQGTTAAVTVGSVEDGYASHVELENIQDDQVVLQFDTHDVHDDPWSVHSSSDAEIADGGTSVYSSPNFETGDAFPNYNWDLSVGDEMNADNPETAEDYELANEHDRDRLVVTDRTENGAATTHTAPEGDQLDNLDDYEDTTITQTNTIAEGDHLIVNAENFGAEGLVEDLSERDSSTSLQQALSEEGIYVELSEQSSGPINDARTWNSSVNNESADQLTLTGITVDEYSGNLIFTVDVPADLETGTTYDFAYKVTPKNTYVSADDGATVQESTLTLEDREVAWDDINSLPATDDATATGTTTVAPGTELPAEADSPNDQGSFVQVTDALVTAGDDGNNQFAAEFDLSEESPGVTFDLYVEDPQDGNVNDELTGVNLTESDGEDESTITVEGDAPSNVEVNESATLDVTVTNNADSAQTVDYHVDIGDETVDNQSLELEAGEEITESYDIDTSAEGDVSWEVHAGDATDEGTVSVSAGGSDDTGGDDSGSDDSGNESGDDSGNESSDDSSSDDSDSDGTPGFGVGVALVALLGAAMLALRRQN